MKRLILVGVVVCALSLVGSVGLEAEEGSRGAAGVAAAPSRAVAAATAVSVLRLVKFSGTVPDAQGTVGITFALYAAQQSGSPLWLETQNVTLDAQGRYTALLGATQNGGLPLEIFSSGEARWLGITVQGQPEQARVLLVAVPYALKAADAETLGGRPPSAFVLAAPPIVTPAGGGAGGTGTTGETTTSTSATGGSAQIVSGTVGRIAKFTAADAVGDSVLFEDGTGKVGLGTTTPVEQLDIAGPSRTRINLGNQSTVQFASSGFSMRLTEAVDAHTQWDFFAEKNTAGSATGQTTFQIRRRNSAQTEAVTPILIDKDTNVILQAGFKAGSQTFGNVGIGTAAPTEKLQVLGNIRIAGGGKGLIFPDNSTLLTAAGLGDITAVNTAAGSGLTGGAASGAANLSLLTSCASGELLKWNGSGWACAADDVGGGGGGSGWSLTGNAGTTAGTNFVGTTDDVALELHVNSTRALRIEPDATSPNIIGGFSGNTVTGGVAGATVGGGGDQTFGNNRVTDDFGTVGGGINNQAGDAAGTTTDHIRATVSGGLNNTASGGGATVAGGTANTASGTASAVGGGGSNTASGNFATIGAGDSNTAGASRATVGGGQQNIASADWSTVSGGRSNSASNTYATVGGGFGNVATGIGATVPGGQSNTASGDFSFAAGQKAWAQHDQTFVWAHGAGGGTITSSAPHQFIAQAAGGFFFQSDSTLDDQGGFINTSTGAFLTAGGVWTDSSDAALKENFAPTDPEEVLARLVALSVQRWNYKAEGPDVHRLGPTAQDFYAAFGLGTDDKHIGSVDAHGVAFAAIQALYRLRQQNAAEIERLRAELAETRVLLEQVRAALAAQSHVEMASTRGSE